MGIPQESNAVFFHPLDDRWARTPGLKWSGAAGFGPGKVDGAMVGVPGTDIVDAGSTGAPTGTADMAFLDDWRLACAGTTGSPNYYPTATAGAVAADGSFSYGSPVMAAAHLAKEVRVCWLDSDRFVLAWLLDTSGDELWMRVGTVSGLDVTFAGSAVQVVLGVHDSSPHFRLAAMPGGSAVVAAYVGTDANAHAIAASVSGSTITPGSQKTFQSSGSPRIAPILPLDSARFVLTWSFHSPTEYGLCEVGTVSGTDITLGGNSSWFAGEPPYTDGQNLTGTPSVAQIGGADDGRFAVVFGRRGGELGSNLRISARHARVSGNSFSFGALCDVDAFSSTSSSVQIAGQLQSDRFVVEYSWYDGATHEDQKAAAVVGSDITFGPRQGLYGPVGSYFEWLHALDTAFYVRGMGGDDSSARRLPVAGALGYETGLADPGDGSDLFGLVGTQDPTAAAARLDASTFVVCHRNAAGHGSASVCSVSGESVSAAAGREFLESAGPEKIAVCALGSASFVVCYQDGSDGDKGKAKVGLVAGGGAVTFGASYQFAASLAGTALCAAALDADRFVIGYDSFVVAGAVGGSPDWDITFGTPRGVPSAAACLAALDSARFVVSGFFTILGTVTGTDITLGNDHQPPAFPNALWAVALSPGTVALFGGAGNAEAVAGAVSGDSISWGAPVSLGGSISGAAAIDSGHFVAEYVGGYLGGGNYSRKCARSGSVTGTAVALDGERELGSPFTEQFNGGSAAVCLSASRSVFVHGFHGFPYDATSWRIWAFVGDIAYGSHPAAAAGTRLAFSSWVGRGGAPA